MAIQCFRRVAGLEEPTDAQIGTTVQLERSTPEENPEPVRNNEQQGLFALHLPAARTSATSHYHNIDLIAVHGLGGDAYRTWQNTNGFNWVQNIQQVLPGIRTYSYGYDTVAAYATELKGFSDYARHILTLLKAIRSSEDTKNRKIVFICHGMGGLLVKQAILIMHNERGLYDNLRESTAAVLFFGTPQSGNRAESYADTLVKMAEAILFPSLVDKINESLCTGLGDVLRPTAPILAEQLEKYRSHVFTVKSVVVLEKKPMPGVDKVLVDDQSGRSWTDKERCLDIIDHDHREICKFSSLKSEALRPVLDELLEIAKELQNSESSIHIQANLAPSSAESAKRFCNDAILKATVAGNVFVVKRLIANHADVNTCDDQQKTLLHLACQYRHTDIGEFLLEHGASTSPIDLNGFTVLHEAALAGEATLVREILERGGDPNITDKNGWTPLHHAAHVGSKPIAESLIEHGASCTAHNDQGDIPAGVARKANHRYVQAYLQLHTLKNESMLVSEVQSRPNSGYMTIAERSHAWAARNAPDAFFVYLETDTAVKKRASRLAKAAERGNLVMVTSLLDVGISPDADALYLAAKERREDVVAVLADAMEDIDEDVGWAGNALCAASCSDNGYATVKILLEKGANVNWQGGKYGGPLQSATINSALNVVKLLLRHGADVNAQCGHYGNAITAAARHRKNFREMASLFVQHGVDINAQGPGAYGNALQTAAHRQHPENVEFLLEHNASKTMPGRFGSARDIVRGEEFLGGRSNIEERDKIAFLMKEEGELLDELFAED